MLRLSGGAGGELHLIKAGIMLKSWAGDQGAAGGAGERSGVVKKHSKHQ